MAGKKGVAVALQMEVNTEEEWQKLLEKEGLIVVDVYSEWCGPCVGMVGNLKKLKLEIGSDYLHLAIAKSDGIEALKRFRNKSEPTWMFIASGHMVNLMFGANAPRLMRLITQELDQETKAIKGERERQTIPFTELTQEEKNRADEIRRKKEEERDREAKELANALEELKLRNLTRRAKMLVDKTVMLYFPHTIDENQTCNVAFKMLAQYDELSMTVYDQISDIQLDKKQITELFYDDDIKLPHSLMEMLETKPCMASLLSYHGVGAGTTDSGTTLPLPLGLVEKALAEYVYGVLSHTEPPVLHSFAEQHLQTMENGDMWPAFWTPLTYLSKASAVKVLFPNLNITSEFKEEELPPPRFCLIFEASRAHEVNDTIEEYPDDILHVGFFDSMEAATAKKVAKNIKQLEKLGPERIKQTKMVLAVAKRKSDPLLAFSSLTPVYISADVKIGSKECNLFFPPPNVFEDEEEENEEVDDSEVDEEEEYDSLNKNAEKEEEEREREGEEDSKKGSNEEMVPDVEGSQENLEGGDTAQDIPEENPSEEQPIV